MANRSIQKEQITTKVVTTIEENIPWGNPTDQKIYHILAEKGPMTRPDLAEKTGLPRSTLFDALTRLLIKGLIERFPEDRQTRGRPRVFYKVPQ